MNEWISVKERMPRNYTEVMVFDAIGMEMFLGAIGSSGEWEIPGYRTDAYNFTHWMPLPEPPKGEKTMAEYVKKSDELLTESLPSARCSGQKSRR